MKAWKWGLGFAVGIACATVAAASEPIKDKDVLEKQYIECAMSGFKDDCWHKLLSKHIYPYSRDVDESPNLARLLREVAPAFGYEGRGSVYKVYPIEKTIVAGIVDYRTYIIEYSSGRFCGLFLRFMKAKEEWYIMEFTIGDNADVLSKILKHPLR